MFSINPHSRFTHGFLSDNLESKGDEHGECFYQKLKQFEQRNQRFWDEYMLRNY